MIVYSGSLDDVPALVRFLREQVPNLRALKKLVVSRENTRVLDVNGDGIEFPGLTYGNATLEEVLRELGVVFNPQVLHNPDATPDGTKEYRLSARWTWGHDRVM